MGWLIVIAIFSISLWLIRNLCALPSITKKDLVIGFSIKVGFALLYILLFTYYFSNGTLMGDTARFFNDSLQINTLYNESPLDFLRVLFGFNPVNATSINILNNTNIWAVGPTTDWINDNKLILKINAIIHFISFKNVYVHALIFSCISYIGILYIYKTFVNFITNKRLFWFVLIAAPNFAFWGSGLLKEAIFGFGFGLWCWAVYQLKNKSYTHMILLMAAAFLLVFNKPYAGLIIVAFTIYIVVGYFTKWSKKGIYSMTMLSIVALLAVIFIPGKLNLTNRLSAKQTDLDNLARGGIAFVNDSAFCVFPYDELSKFTQVGNDSIMVRTAVSGQYKIFGQSNFKDFIIQPSTKPYAVYLIYQPSGSYIAPTLIKNSPIQLLRNTGSAMVNVWLRPFPTDPGDKLKILNFINNLGLLFIVAVAVMRRRRLAQIEKYLVASLLGSAIMISLIIGWSVPIFGAIVRYKIPVELLIIITSFILLKSLKHENIQNNRPL
ncbi:MAG: hypothetical protein R3279_10720 [Putridiphycobacter sp.]|nr:hypothetical protein [Putridiphycobacter sp.]